MTEKKYEIGDKTYIQRPLVLGQLRQLLDILKGVSIPANGDARALIIALSGHLPAALAVVLIPEGVSLRDKDLAALASEIEFAISPEQVFEVVEDFLGCNPFPSLLQRLTWMMTAAAQAMERTESSASVSSLPEGTLPGETPSSGDTLQ